MFDDIHKDIVRSIQLFNDGRVENALQVLNKFEEKGDLNPDNKHYFQFYKAFSLFSLGKVQDALNIANKRFFFPGIINNKSIFE